MSHQTGIRAAESLQKSFATSKDGKVRMMKVIIEDEQLKLAHSYPAQGNWEQDYDNAVLPQLEDKSPCYILYRLDEADSSGYRWIYISYVPDFAPVRQKMLYAATRATLKTEFGGAHIKDEVFGTAKDDVSLKGYHKHLASEKAPPPLTFAEEELAEIKKKETGVEISVDTRHQTISGVAFPMSKDAADNIKLLKAGKVEYVQLSLELQQERIDLADTDNIPVGSLASKVPLDHARYHLFRFKHTHEGDYQEAIIFIYSMPGYKCSIKERMLYSSCKAPLLEVIEQQLGVELARKLEIDDPSELTEANIYNEVHPPKNVAKQKFAKPKGPAGRGPKRLTKRE